MEIVNTERLMPMSNLLKLAYSIKYTQTRKRQKYSTHERQIKVISGELIPGKKVYTEDYTEDGSTLLSIKTSEYHTPFVIRTADEVEDTYRVNQKVLQNAGVNGYQTVIEIIDVINYFDKEGEVVDNVINSELIIGW